jgi:CDP-diglyceride synthetase
MIRIHRHASVADYIPVAATAVWGFTWLAAAWLAATRVATSPDTAAYVGLTVATLLAGACCWLTLKLTRGKKGIARRLPSPKETWSRRIIGWIAAIVWCGVAMIWNISTIGMLLRSANEGRGWHILFLMPWCFVGWVLLVVLFADGAVLVDSIVCRLRTTAGGFPDGKRAAETDAAEP